MLQFSKVAIVRAMGVCGEENTLTQALSLKGEGANTNRWRDWLFANSQYERLTRAGDSWFADRTEDSPALIAWHRAFARFRFARVSP